jgi:hypothetical protein
MEDGLMILDNFDENQQQGKERRYNISITYDEYYHSPRFWLYGT